MKKSVSKATAEARVVRKYTRLYTLLIELVTALQDLEPGGTFVDEAVFEKKDDGQIRVTYKARPVQLIIADRNRRFTLRVEEQE